jgi:hypothetical protein
MRFFIFLQALLSLITIALLLSFCISCASVATDDDANDDMDVDADAEDTTNDDTSDDDSDDDVDDDMDDDVDDDADDDVDDDLNDDSDDDDDVWIDSAPRPTDAIGIFVSTSGDDLDPGTMAEPMRTIRAGVAKAESDGKMVFIAGGQYVEIFDTRVSVYGGYRDTDWLRDLAENETHVVFFGSSYIVNIPEDADEVVIDGLHINNTMPLYNVVGLLGKGRKITLRNNNIRTLCSIYSFAESTAVWLEDVEEAVFEHNIIESGPAYAAWTPTTADSLAVYIRDGGSVTMVSNLLKSGSAQGDAWLSGESIAVKMNCDNALLIGNTFSTDKAVISVGHVGASIAVWADATTSFALINNILQVDRAQEMIGLRFSGFGGVTLMNNDFTGIFNPDRVLARIRANIIRDSATMNDCLWNGCRQSGGNLDQAPLFYGQGDYHLMPGSPCIDAGIDPNTWFEGVSANWDLDLERRPQGAGWDIGMDEYLP